MRKNNLEQISTNDATSYKTPIIVLSTLTVLGFLVWSYFQFGPNAISEGPADVEVLSESQREAYLERDGIDKSYAGVFSSTNALSKAAQSGKSKQDALEKTIDKLEMTSKNGTIGWPVSNTLDRDVVAGKIAVTKSQNGERIYPIEASLAVVGALREAGYEAIVVEVSDDSGWGFPGDGSGRLGYFAPAILSGTVKDGKLQSGKLIARDAFRGRGKLSKENLRPLSDMQAIAAVLNANAMHQLAFNSKTSEALRLSKNARKLDPKAPYIREGYGLILGVSGDPRGSIQELKSANDLRSDSSRKINLAQALLVTGEKEEASKSIESALQAHPEYALAHAMRAALALSNRDLDKAFASLSQAQKLDPSMHETLTLWAQYYASSGEIEKAVNYAEKAEKSRPQNWQNLIQSGMIYRAANRYTDLQRVGKRALLLGASRDVIERSLGPAALAEDVEEDDEEYVASGDLKLDSELLGTKDNDNTTLLGDDLDLGLGSDSDLSLPGGRNLNGESFDLGGEDFQLGGAKNSGPRLRLDD